MSVRRVCVVTGSRAEYGLLRPLLDELDLRRDLQLLLAVTGSHFSARHGRTVGEIERDGREIAFSVPLDLQDDSPLGVARAMARVLEAFAGWFERERPEWVVLLGDRWEALAVAQAAVLTRRPIAHLHGGESTEGTIDEAIRHAITKMAHLHFTAAEAYRRRVIQLGEDPERVLWVGAIGLDGLEQTGRLERAELERRLGLELVSPLFAVTYHPVTLAEEGPERPLGELLAGLERVAPCTVVFTGAAADLRGGGIAGILTEHCRGRADRRQFPSLGREVYLSLLRQATAVVGNSSSGLLEAPALGVAAVDVGPRQRGRMRPPSVLHCDEDRESVARAITQALSPAHQALAREAHTPYRRDGRAAARIANELARVDPGSLLFKRFHPLGPEGGEAHAATITE